MGRRNARSRRLQEDKSAAKNEKKVPPIKLILGENREIRIKKTEGFEDQKVPEIKKELELEDIKQEIKSEPEYEDASDTISEVEEDLGSEPDDLNYNLPENVWEEFYKQNENGNTYLHLSIKESVPATTINIIRMAPEPHFLDIYNYKKQTALHLAILAHEPVVVRRLILAGCNPALRNNNGNTALHLACASGDVDCVKALTLPIAHSERNLLRSEEKIPVLTHYLEQWNNNGQTVLHLAALNGSIELVKYLVDVGADIEAREGKAGNTPLLLAMDADHHDLVNFLLQEVHPNLETPEYSGRTPYQIAVRNEEVDLAQKLLKYGALELDVPSEDESTSSGSESEKESDSD